MSRLLYREDIDEVRKRLTTWWEGGDIGRPAMPIHCPRPEPLEKFPPMAQPEGWVTGYSTKSFEYRVYLSKTGPGGAMYFGEAVPATAPDLAPNCVALYLGCQGVEMPGTVWCKPFIQEPVKQHFKVDFKNFYWDFSWRLAQEQAKLGKGKFFVAFPDLIEGLDTLEAMRGAEKLLFDLYDRPEWVHDCLDQITELYFHYYDRFYDLIKDETGGSCFWSWAPGRMAKLQCDFSAMIGPDMFGEFMVPVLRRMTARLDHCMYHWDGPGAIPHHDHLLSLPDLDMLQWTPGAGQANTDDPKWFPLYHKTVDAGKKIFAGASSLDTLKRMKKEFGPKLKQFYLPMWLKTPAEAEEALRIAQID